MIDFLIRCACVLVGVLVAALLYDRIEREAEALASVQMQTRFAERFCFEAVRTGITPTCRYGRAE